MQVAPNTKEKEKSHPAGHKEYRPKVLKSLFEEIHKDIVTVGVDLFRDGTYVGLFTPPPKEGQVE